MQGNQAAQQLTSGAPQLPLLYSGQKIKTGPYTTTVTDEMVAQRERENQELYRAWREQQQRGAMGPNEDASSYVGDFKYEEVRRSFIRKIFLILTLQLIFTTSVIAVFLFVDAAKIFMIQHWWLWIVAFICFTISYCAVSCSERARRTPPFNYILLCKLTIALSYLAAFASVSYDTEIVLMAFGMTSIMAFIIGFLATCLKFDLTMRTGLLTVAGLASILGITVMMIVLIFTYIRVLHIIISVIGMVVLSMYLYFDVQTIMGGRRIEIHPDEVVFATVQIYVDIVLLYQYILMFMGLMHDQ